MARPVGVLAGLLSVAGVAATDSSPGRSARLALAVTVGDLCVDVRAGRAAPVGVLAAYPPADLPDLDAVWLERGGELFGLPPAVHVGPQLREPLDEGFVPGLVLPGRPDGEQIGQQVEGRAGGAGLAVRVGHRAGLG